MPGIGLVIEGAMQHAPQLSRQFMTSLQSTTGLPSGMPGIGLVIEGAVQQAP
jgi:hypothetical protein